MRFEDKIVIVTGAARGIGKAIALGFASEGAAGVVIADVRHQQGEETAAQISQMGSKGVFLHTDVSDKPQVDTMVALTAERFGKIDVLVNDAGICPFEDFLTMPEAVWEQVLDVNLKGVFLVSQAVGRVMVEKGTPGRIVNVGSISSGGGHSGRSRHTIAPARQVLIC